MHFLLSLDGMQIGQTYLNILRLFQRNGQSFAIDFMYCLIFKKSLDKTQFKYMFYYFSYLALR